MVDFLNRVQKEGRDEGVIVGRVDAGLRGHSGVWGGGRRERGRQRQMN